MLRKFAEANRLTKKTDAGLFITPRDIPSLQLKSEDTIIFVDDLSGSGQQVLNGWQTMNELIASDAKAHLILTAVTDRALRLIAQNTRLNVIAQYVIPNKGNVFHDSCTFLAKNEKLALLKYCEKADSKVPRGYGDCGLLLVLSHKTPNNSIPILHVYHKEWHGLFPRYLPTN